MRRCGGTSPPHSRDAFVSAGGRVRRRNATGYVLALHMQLIPSDLRAAAARELAEAIRRADCHLTTGFAGVGYLLPVLSSTGYTSLAYRLLAQRSRPSWRYMIDHGATTIWERWDGWTSEHGFAPPTMNSFNHYSLSSVGEWLYRFVLGIEPRRDRRASAGCCSARIQGTSSAGPPVRTTPSAGPSPPAGASPPAASSSPPNRRRT